jgi:hypothetical protein
MNKFFEDYELKIKLAHNKANSGDAKSRATD